YCNSMYQFELVSAIAASADFSWHPEKHARSAYLAVGGRPVRVQMGADPDLCRPISRIERQRKACFVGQRYADRERWLAALIEANIPIDIYGSGWGHDVGAEGQVASPGKEFYLGRKQTAPGSLASYLQLGADEVRRHGAFRALKRLALRANYRRQTRGLHR